MRFVIRFSLSAIVLLWLGVQLFPQKEQPDDKGKLRGTVADIVNAPVRNAFVLLHSEVGAGDVPANLNEEGQFELTFTPGLYDVFVAAPGFVPFCKKIEVFAHRTTALKVNLRPDQENLQQSASPK